MNDRLGRRLLRAGGVWIILFGLVHSIGIFQDIPPGNEFERQLLNQLSSYRFFFAGTPRTIVELLRGFSLAFVVAMVGLGSLNLAVAGQAATTVKRVAGLNVLWFAALAAISLRYFFIIPTLFLVVALVVFVAAWAMLPKGQTT